MSTPTSDSPSKTNDENMYGNNGLNSPTFETVDHGAGESTDPKFTETPEERAERLKGLQEELDKIEEEIGTLRSVLGSKVRRAAEIKRQMGITPFQEFKQDLQHGIKSIQDSDAYQKTNEKIHDINDKITHSTAYQKTSSVLTSVGSTVSRKLSDVRNSTAFKSMEEKVGGAVANVKAKVTGSKSENNFEEALQEEAKGDNSGNADDATEKVPL